MKKLKSQESDDVSCVDEEKVEDKVDDDDDEFIKLHKQYDR